MSTPHLLRRTAGTGIVVSTLGVAAVTGLIYALRDVMPVEAAGVLYLLPVLLASSYWGLAVGRRYLGRQRRSRSTSSTFRPPVEFTIADEENWVALVVFFAVAGVTSTLAGTARGARRRGRARPPRGRPDRGDGAGAARRREPRGLAAGRRSADRAWRSNCPGSRSRPAGPTATSAGGRCRSWSPASERGRSRSRATPTPSRSRLLERRVIPGLETLLTAARRARGTRGAGDRDTGAAALERGQDRAPALRLARPALAADRDHHRRRRARLADPGRGGAGRAGRGDRGGVASG